jgi:hypothetical protein
MMICCERKTRTADWWVGADLVRGKKVPLFPQCGITRGLFSSLQINSEVENE